MDLGCKKQIETQLEENQSKKLVSAEAEKYR